MAEQIQVQFSLAAATLYAVIRNSAGEAWDTVASAFEAYATANLGDYDIALTEQGTASRYYAADFPALAAGLYNVAVFRRAGASPAETDPIVAMGPAWWDGAAFIVPSALDAAGVRTAVGLASANLDTQLAALPTAEENAAEVRTELATELARVDVATSTRAATGDAMTLTAGERTAIADAHLDRADGIEVGLTPRGAHRLEAAAAAAKLAGAGTDTVTLRNAVADSKVRITATVDEDGNRTAVTTDVT